LEDSRLESIVLAVTFVPHFLGALLVPTGVLLLLTAVAELRSAMSNS
jgi:hypothetical protein